MTTTAPEPIVRTIRLDSDFAVQGECPLCAVDYGADDLLDLAGLLAEHLFDAHGATSEDAIRYESMIAGGDDATAREIAEQTALLVKRGLTPEDAMARTVADTATAFSIADDLADRVERGEITVEEAEAQIAGLVEERIR